MKLHNYWRSSASWRVRIGLAFKNVSYEYLPVNLIEQGGKQHAPEYKQLNPMEQVPTLVLDDGRQLSQSLAILEYLEETVPRPSLLPADPYLRARARQLAEVINAGIQPMQNLGTMQQLHARGLDAKEWVAYFITRGLDALEASAAPTAGTFLVGDAPSFADVCLVPQLYNARRFSMDVSRWQLLVRVDEACAKLAPFIAAHADHQPDTAKGA